MVDLVTNPRSHCNTHQQSIESSIFPKVKKGNPYPHSTMLMVLLTGQLFAFQTFIHPQTNLVLLFALKTTQPKISMKMTIQPVKLLKY